MKGSKGAGGGRLGHVEMRGMVLLDGPSEVKKVGLQALRCISFPNGSIICFVAVLLALLLRCCMSGTLHGTLPPCQPTTTLRSRRIGVVLFIYFSLYSAAGEPRPWMMEVEESKNLQLSV